MAERFRIRLDQNMSPVDADMDKLNTGMELELVVYKLYKNEGGNDEIQQHYIC